MALINSKTAVAMLAEARKRWGADLSDWWLVDEALVWQWLKSRPIGEGEAMALPIGGAFVWLMPFPDGSNMDCRGIGLDGAPAELRDARDIHKGFAADRFVAWFTPLRAAAKAKAESEARPIRLGTRLCIKMKGSGDWRLAMVTALEPLTVALEQGAAGQRYELAALSEKWFAPWNRDDGFDSLWNEGKTEYSAYIGMLASLARRQKKADKAAQTAKV